MRWHLHKWGPWQDVKIGDECKVIPGWPYPLMRQVIRQQSRCSVCNRVRTVSS